MKNLTVTKMDNIVKKMSAGVSTLLATLNFMTMRVFANGWDNVTVKPSSDKSPVELFGQVIGIILTITRYVGIGMLIFGVYELVMSFLNDMPDKKTKGITFALVGLVLVFLKSVLKGFGVIQ